MAATAPSMEEILQTVCQKAAATISPTRPTPYSTSHSFNDYEDVLPTEPEPERFIRSCHRRSLQEGDIEFLQAMPVIYHNQKSTP